MGARKKRRRSKSKSRYAGCRPTTSTCCNSMKSSAWRTPSGCLRQAAVEAKKAGKVRYIGFTGHKSPDIHLHMLETADEHEFRFDTVQMPLNVMDTHYNSFGKKV